MQLSNGWTGAQYSVFRGLLGLYLAWHLAALVPWGTELFSSAGVLPEASDSPLFPLFPSLFFWLDAPIVVTTALCLGAALALGLAAGTHDRICALLLWGLWASLHARNPFISNPSLPFIGWLLLAHALLPSAPWGSWSARRRGDPDFAWRMPPAVFAVAWVVMALAYTYSGIEKLGSPSWIDGSALSRVLHNPLARPGAFRDLLLAAPPLLLTLGTWGGLALEVAFAPLALFRRLRPWLWLAMTGMHLSLLLLIDFADLTLGMLLLHGFTFDPGWVPGRSRERTTLFYDGACGLCHGTVRFLLSEDRDGRAFAYSPLQGETVARTVDAETARDLPDSIVMQRSDGRLLSRSEAMLEAGRDLGGLWRVAAEIVRLIPLPIRDFVYDRVAASRHRFFRRPDDACPLVPPELRSRFLP